jgi:hypothetical protein
MAFRSYSGPTSSYMTVAQQKFSRPMLVPVARRCSKVVVDRMPTSKHGWVERVAVCRGSRSCSALMYSAAQFPPSSGPLIVTRYAILVTTCCCVQNSQLLRAAHFISAYKFTFGPSSPFSHLSLMTTVWRASHNSIRLDTALRNEAHRPGCRHAGAACGKGKCHLVRLYPRMPLTRPSKA